MKSINLSLIFISSLFFFSCQENDTNLPNSFNKIPLNKIESIIKDSGLSALRNQHQSGDTKITWNAFHENYLESVSKYKNHENWNSYSSNLINYLVLRTNLLDDINQDNYSILETYSEELKSLQTAYPKTHYLILKKLQLFVKHEKIENIAKSVYKKASKQMQKAKDDLDSMPESDVVETIAKEGLRKSYEENYEVYLPKLKEFFSKD